jgi:hypothetical protein
VPGDPRVGGKTPGDFSLAPGAESGVEKSSFEFPVDLKKDNVEGRGKDADG